MWRFDGLGTHMLWRGISLCLLFLFLNAAGAQEKLRLSGGSRDTNGWFHLLSAGAEHQVHSLEASTDLRRWTNIATLFDGPLDFADPKGSAVPFRFYRFSSRARTPSDDGKNQVSFPTDPFRSPSNGGLEEVRWIKFAIVLSDTNRVWFQDSDRYAFHYDFAKTRLESFRDLTRAQFDAISLRTNGQQVVLGAVLLPPENFTGSPVPEYGIQFVGLDPYTPQQIMSWFRLVETAIYKVQPGRAFYLPTFEQLGVAQQNQTLFVAAGIPISSAERWLRNNVCYSDGWAFGRLVFIHSNEITEAYRDGRLLPADILVTDGVPAEVPFLAGLITLVPATPNSHVAILARSYRIPFAYVVDTSVRNSITNLLGKTVALTVENQFLCEVRVAGIDPNLDPALRNEILALKSPGPVALIPKARFGSYSTNVDGIKLTDRRYFGGKAAGYGIIRRVVPTNSNFGVAFSFDLWDDFLDQKLPGATNTLRQEIKARLGVFKYPPNIAAVEDALAEVRGLIRTNATFSIPQQEQILAALNIFQDRQKVRFRSSSNVEDSEQFTGAGIYDSFSGCISDDMDPDSTGPSLCDPAEKNERGVFRAIQRVYASFYNDNAFLERLRFNLNEDQVGMAVLAHYSFPDEQEMANGVATVRVNLGQFSSYRADMVTQLGAVSVTNPDGDARAEVVTASRFFGSTFLDSTQQSSLVQLGAHVMAWQNDYTALAFLLFQASDAFAAESGKNELVLDVEYKKMQPGALVLKQVRQLPAAPAGTNLPAFLLNQPAMLCTEQGEFGNVLAKHRLKARLNLEARNTRLSSNLTSSLFTNIAIEFISGGKIVTMTNGFGGWPGARFAKSPEGTEDHWRDSAVPAREMVFQSNFEPSVSPDQSPLLTQADLLNNLSAVYDQPVPSLDFDGTITTSREDSTRLVPCPLVTAQSLLQTRDLTSRGGLRVETIFYWPEPPRGPTAGYTAPLQEWVQTTISGVGSSAVVLKNYFSQTYHPFHHNFAEDFFFEPGLDPNVTPGQLAAFQAANIRGLLIHRAEDGVAFKAWGFDGKFRDLP